MEQIYSNCFWKRLRSWIYKFSNYYTGSKEIFQILIFVFKATTGKAFSETG